MKITVHVKPGSRKESIEWVSPLVKGGEKFRIKKGGFKSSVMSETWQLLQKGAKTLVVKIREKPVDGEANKWLIEALSEFFDVPKSRINIVLGHTSREKVVEIIDVE
jgi:uncharacterized protein YggU (UPF0235/DUF167 family)